MNKKELIEFYQMLLRIVSAGNFSPLFSYPLKRKYEAKLMELELDGIFCR